MAGMTIKLLQIVYGADFKRLDQTFDKFDALVDGFDVDAMQKAPADFVNNASALATEANRLATYIAQKAADEEDEYAKQQMMEVAQKLNKLVWWLFFGNDSLGILLMRLIMLQIILMTPKLIRDLRIL